jgi:hypothetical protein
MNEAKDRRTLNVELVERKGYFNEVMALETRLNGLIEPYMHLYSMTAHLCHNALDSRLKIPLDEAFYSDYMKLADCFKSNLEGILAVLPRIKTRSREMQMLLEPIKIMFEEGQPMYRTFKLLSRLSIHPPKNIEDLIRIFKSELDDNAIKKNKDIEDYSSETDIKYNDRKQAENRSEDFMYSFKESDTESLYFPQLERLISDFLEENPIGCSKRWISYLNSVGSRLSAFTANAEWVQKKKWCKPKIVSGKKPIIKIVNGYYPFTQTKGEIIKNDTMLGEDARIEIVDGSNAAGKSVDTRKTAFIVCTAMSGNYAPADSVTISWLDHVRYRIKSTGIGWRGAMVQELTELMPCVNVLDTKSFIGLDELLTSTNHDEGGAMNYGIVLKGDESPGALIQITSHYGSLHDLLNDPRIKNVRFMHFEYQADANGKITFDYKKRDGPNTQSDYALVIAEHEKINPRVLKHAKEFLERKESKAGDLDDA